MTDVLLSPDCCIIVVVAPNAVVLLICMLCRCHLDSCVAINKAAVCHSDYCEVVPMMAMWLTHLSVSGFLSDCYASVSLTTV